MSGEKASDATFKSGHTLHSCCSCCEHAANAIIALEQEIAMLKQVYAPMNRTHVTEAEKARIRADVRSGHSMRKVAKRYGLKSASAVHRIVHSAGGDT